MKRAHKYHKYHETEATGASENVRPKLRISLLHTFTSIVTRLILAINLFISELVSVFS